MTIFANVAIVGIRVAVRKFGFAVICVLNLTAFANPAAVVRCQTNGGMYSAVVITPELALTAKHCTAGHEHEAVQCRFQDGREVTARFFAQAKDSEGPALLKLPKGEYPTAKIAYALPKAWYVTVTAMGYPQGTYKLNKSTFQLYPARGKLGLDGNGYGNPISGDSFVNEASGKMIPGYSGGGVFYRGELVGLISSTDDRTSLHITHASIAKFVSRYGVRPVQADAERPANPAPKFERESTPVPKKQPELYAERPDCGNGWHGGGIGLGVGGPHGGLGIGAGIGWRDPAPRAAEPPAPWHGKRHNGQPWIVFIGRMNDAQCKKLDTDLLQPTEVRKTLDSRYSFVYSMRIENRPRLWANISKMYDHDGSVPFVFDSFGRTHAGYGGDPAEILDKFTGNSKDEKPAVPEKPAEPTPIPQVPTPVPDPQPQVDLDGLKSELKAELRALLVDIDILGTPGRDGIDGKPGRDGKDGAPGPRGANGLQGIRGEPGPPGRNGKDADPEQVQALKEAFAQLYHEFHELKQQLAQATKPEDVAAIRDELDRLKAIEFPVQVLTPDGQVFSQDVVRLGDPIQLRLVPKQKPKTIISP